jgi:hypothetical protein
VIWLTWRQHRLEAIGAALLLLPFTLAVIGLITAVRPLLDQASVACAPVGSGQGLADACSAILEQYTGRFGFVHQILHVGFLALPVLPGLFVGAPLLAREFEQGTEQIVWTQGITRERWIFSKLAILGGATVLTAALLGAIAGQWADAQPASMRSLWYSFDLEMPTYIAYSFFSFALGMAAGAAIRRTVAAMAAALVGFVGVRLLIGLLARRSYQPPLDWDVTTGLVNQTDAWLLDGQRHVDLHGNAVSDGRFGEVASACASSPPGTFGTCLRDQGIVVLQAYQPAGRFWTFVAIESAIFIALALALLGLAIFLVRRRA